MQHLRTDAQTLKLCATCLNSFRHMTHWNRINLSRFLRAEAIFYFWRAQTCKGLLEMLKQLLIWKRIGISQINDRLVVSEINLELRFLLVQAEQDENYMKLIFNPYRCWFFLSLCSVEIKKKKKTTFTSICRGNICQKKSNPFYLRKTINNI